MNWDEINQVLHDAKLMITAHTWLPSGWDYLEKGVEHSFRAQHKLLDRLFKKWNINE